MNRFKIFKIAIHDFARYPCPKIFLLATLTVIALTLPPQSRAQFINLDFNSHSVGEVRQILNNQGTFASTGYVYYPGLINTEYPIGTFTEHLNAGGWFVGGITPSGDTLVTTTQSFALNAAAEFEGFSSKSNDGVFKFPSEAHDLTIDPPPDYFYQSYERFSHEDLLTRYNDYNRATQNIHNHRPLYLDVYQVSYAWGNPVQPFNRPDFSASSNKEDRHPLDNIIVVTYRVTPTKFPIDNIYIGSFFDPAIERRTGGSFDFGGNDVIRYNPEARQTITYDWNLGEPIGQSSIGTQLMPPSSRDRSTLTWTWHVRTGAQFDVENDIDRYQLMSSGRIDHNPRDTSANQVYMQSTGPFELESGDTLKFSIALALGRTPQTVQKDGGNLKLLHQQEYHLPQQPPAPEITTRVNGRKVTIQWDESAESFSAPYRLDGDQHPFEGYRVYKYTGNKQRYRDWTLLAQFDRTGNDYGPNTGLQYRFIDRGLSTLQEYQYAVTAFTRPDSVLDYPPVESEINSSNMATIVGSSGTHRGLDSVAVVPNPYRTDVDYRSGENSWEKLPPDRSQWSPSDRRLQFINLPERATIEIYTLSGQLIETIQHHQPGIGTENWNLTNQSGESISSGIYLYTVTNERTGNTRTGKFVVIL